MRNSIGKTASETKQALTLCQIAHLHLIALRIIRPELIHALHMQDLFTQRNRPEDMGALIRRLTCAAMHSRAAYGYAMAAGHLSSLLNFALLQTVSAVLC